MLRLSLLRIRTFRTAVSGSFFTRLGLGGIPFLLPLIRAAAPESLLDEDNLSYFVSHIELVPGQTPGMSNWRKHLFIATSRITADAAEYFRLPRERTVIMGSRIEL